MSAEVQPIVTAEEVRQAVESLGRRLQELFEGKTPLFLSALGGSVIFLADLVRVFEKPARFDFIRVDYKVGSTARAENEHGHDADPEAATAASNKVLDIHYPLPVKVEGQDIVLVKDVVTSGLTETYLLQQLKDRGAKSVYLVALIDKPDERKLPIEPDDRALSLAGTETFVGYGLKQDGLHGNLPFIGRLP